MPQIQIEGFGNIEIPNESEAINAINAFHADPSSGQFYDTVPRTFNNESQRIEPIAPTLRDKIFNRAIDFFLDPNDDPIARQTAIRYANNVTQVLDFTGVGDAMDASEAMQAFGDGDYLDGAILTGVAALGIVPVIGDVGQKALRSPSVQNAAREVRQKLNVWHGSPHKFDRFDLSKIGTGEGAQAYGHGLYFADSPDVAKSYQPRSYDAEDLMMQRYKAAEGIEDYEAMEVWESAMQHETPSEIINRYSPEEYGDEFAAKAKAIAEELNTFPAEGGIYNVDLDVDPNTMLDWDAPLSEQSEGVQGMYIDIMKPTQEDNDLLSALFEGASEQELAMIDNAPSYMETMDGRAFYGSLKEKLGSDVDASSYLRERGVSGIRYLDGTSRSAGEGTRNYVIFDDSLANIKSVE